MGCGEYGRVRANWNYPRELPVVGLRDEILRVLRESQVVVVVSDTGSGKTTQLPKMVAEAVGDGMGWVGCTQPRRIAASSVAERVAEELDVPLGGLVGYKVRFEDRTGEETVIKFMTDGILLAEIQGDPMLSRYRAIILDEAHERSLNIDFLLGYLKELLPKRPDLKLVISSATLDAGSFAVFFGDGESAAPVVEAEGRMFPVAEFFLPPEEEEDLQQHVARAVEWLSEMDPDGDVLVFLPGEREIRECAEVLEGRQFRGTEVLPMFARLGLADQQRVFHPGSLRRLILATNVAETSLTIPRIACVVDSGVARVSRWNPSRGVQKLQVEPVSRASARQRKGRCGRVRDGLCVRLYDEQEAEDRAEFTDPEIRRSSLAGVILRMKLLGLPEIGEFPFLDPPSPKAVSEGYRTLREVGAIDRGKRLTELGARIGRLPVDPRLGRMLVEAEKEGCLGALVPVIAALESNDPRERPADKVKEADESHALWNDGESDFLTLLRMWEALSELRKHGGGWQVNRLRKFCKARYLSFRRVIEWANVADELADLLKREWRAGSEFCPAAGVSHDALHRSLLAGVPRQFGCWDKENKAYRSAAGGLFAVFPGSGLFGLPKRHEWVMGMELVETSRLWARRAARIEPEWVEQVAGHLCHYRHGEAHWDVAQGAVYGVETVTCGGLPVVTGRRIHYGRVDPEVARAVFLREGLLGGGIKKKCGFLDHLDELRGLVEEVEHKLRRPSGLWSEEAVLRWFEEKIPNEIHTAAAFHKWLAKSGENLMISLGDVLEEELESLGLEGYPDVLAHDGEEYPLYYHTARGERDDGVTVGVHVDQLPSFPGWLLTWGVDGQLRERVEWLLRGMPKDYRRACHPIAQAADAFVDHWRSIPKKSGIAAALREFLSVRHHVKIEARIFDDVPLPEPMRMKVWVCGDDGEELAFGEDVDALRVQLADRMAERFEAMANSELERHGMHAWDGEELPEKVMTPGGAVFPALVDEGRCVGIRAFPCESQARESHRAGLARLLLLGQSAQAGFLEKKYPLGMMARVEMGRLCEGGLGMEELMMLAAEGAAGEESPRSPEGFLELSARARGEWHAAGLRIGEALEEIVRAALEVRMWIDDHRDDRNYGEIANDLHEQLDWLLRRQFAWRAGFSRLCDYPRRMDAIRSRLARLESLPIVRDLEKLDRVKRLWTPWYERWRAAPDDPVSWNAGWMLDEWRISLFAPDVPLRGKVSEKQLAKLCDLG